MPLSILRCANFAVSLALTDKGSFSIKGLRDGAKPSFSSTLSSMQASSSRIMCDSLGLFGMLDSFGAKLDSHGSPLAFSLSLQTEMREEASDRVRKTICPQVSHIDVIFFAFQAVYNGRERNLLGNYFSHLHFYKFSLTGFLTSRFGLAGLNKASICSTSLIFLSSCRLA